MLSQVTKGSNGYKHTFLGISLHIQRPEKGIKITMQRSPPNIQTLPLPTHFRNYKTKRCRCMVEKLCLCEAFKALFFSFKNTQENCMPFVLR